MAWQLAAFNSRPFKAGQSVYPRSDVEGIQWQVGEPLDGAWAKRTIGFPDTSTRRPVATKYWRGVAFKNCGQLSLESAAFLSFARIMKTNHSVSSAQRRFKVPRLSAVPWPQSPLLELPAGSLRSYYCGRILTADHFVLAVGLSPEHYLAVSRAPGVGPVDIALEQAIGFLYGRGAVVIRTHLRAPLMWFAENHGDFSWKKCLVFFARIFLSSDPTDPPWIPSMIWPVVPLGVVASAGMDHWRRVNEVLEGVEMADSGLLTQLGTSLAAMARRWEFYMARMVVLSLRAGDYDADDRKLVEACDRLLFSIMARFEPGYKLLPATTMRLL